MAIKVFEEPAPGMRNATSYTQWKRAAISYDKTHHLDQWRRSDKTDLYDYSAIRSRLSALRKLRKAGDHHGLLFALNEGIHGNMAGMGRVALYRYAKFGTKKLIGDYVKEISSALEYIAEASEEDIALDEKMEFFHRASHCFGRSAFLMSGSGSLLYFHLGAAKALWAQGLLPKIISGSSGGSIVAALVGTHTDDELGAIFDPDFLETEAAKEEGILQYLRPFTRKRMPAEEVYKLIDRLIPDLSFQQAYELTGVHINISVAPADRHQSSRLLNAITSPNVMIREAVIASCAVPGIYPPVTLAALDAQGNRIPYLPGRKWIDGSVAEDLPIKRLSRLYGVNHTIVSQTNPIVLPFINKDKNQRTAFGIIRDVGLGTVKEWTLATARLLSKPMSSSPMISRLLTTYVSVVSQTYTGDINIIPPSRATNLINLVSPKTKKEILELVAKGEKSTWPNIEMIRNQTCVSRALDNILGNFEIGVIRAAQKHLPLPDKGAENLYLDN